LSEIAHLYSKVVVPLARNAKVVGCALAIFGTIIEVALNVAGHQKITGETWIGLGAGIATACVFGALGFPPTSGRALILLPVLAGFIGALVDALLQWKCTVDSGHPETFSIQHVIITGFAAAGIAAGGAVLGTLGTQFEIALGSAILSGDAAGAADLVNQGGAC